MIISISALKIRAEAIMFQLINKVSQENKYSIFYLREIFYMISLKE
jgi:hypothetical protein